ncbi:MAG: sigma-54 dependent transcriptional regulator [Gammaproteobacteria bacterium]|nr:sigma-54 dependent transcriptional regulator [Gammaproteobacteria bacterium]
MRSTVLVVEDDQALQEALCDTVALGGYRTLAANNGVQALDVLKSEAVDAVISDIHMTPMDGHELLREIRQRYTELPVLLMTAFGSMASAVEALRDGATDYVVKPFESEVLVSKVEQLLPARGAAEEEMVAADPATQAVRELAARVAASDANVMITGESGVGKEVFFRFVHANSRRRDHVPVAINCAAIPENMLEAILFGYEKGAYTGAHKASPGKFEQANGSTLLLDEISEMSMPLQAKLLRVLQEQQVERLGSNQLIELDVRIVATSNRDLKQAIAAGEFREDLFFRLNVFPLHIPPLRERPADILPMAERFIAAAAARSGLPAIDIAESAAQRLIAHRWHGNVRELDNVMQRGLILAGNGPLEAEHLMFEGAPAVGAAESPTAAVSPGVPAAAAPDDTLGSSLKDRERRLILDALREGGGSRKFAAEKLGISPRTLRYKIAEIKDAGIEVPGRQA